MQQHDIKCLLLYLKGNQNTRNAIEIASSNRCKSNTLKYLIEQKADVHASALHIAVNDDSPANDPRRQINKIKLLLDAGANPLINTLKLASNIQFSAINAMIVGDTPRNHINKIIHNIRWSSRKHINREIIENILWKLKSTHPNCIDKIYYENISCVGGHQSRRYMIENIASRLLKQCTIHQALYQRYVNVSTKLVWCLQNSSFWKEYPGFIPFLVSQLLMYTNDISYKYQICCEKSNPSYILNDQKLLFRLYC